MRKSPLLCLSPQYFLVNQDATLEEKWANVEPKPVVFLQGLHRSGTTFLLNTLQAITGAAALTVQDIAYYRQRVFAKSNGLETQQQSSIATYFQHYHLTHRPIDNVPLSPTTLDEFGYVYSRLGIPINERGLLAEIIVKLSFVYPTAPFVLLKEPKIFAASSVAYRVCPDAKFVFVHRNPVETLVSRCRAAFWRRSLFRDWAYLHLLTGKPIKLSKRMSSLLLPKRKGRIAMSIAHDILNQVRSYQQDLKFVPVKQTIHIEYEELVQATDAVLARLVGFLNVRPIKPVSSFQGSPRKRFEVGDEVKAAGDWLTAQLRSARYQHSSLGLK